MWPFKKKEKWIYGKCNNLPARKHPQKGNVQMMLHRAGTNGHKKDYWYDFDPTWWNEFIPNK